MIFDFITVAPFIFAALHEKFFPIAGIIFLVAWMLELFSLFSFGVSSLFLCVAIYVVRSLRALFDESSRASIVLAFCGGVVTYVGMTVVALLWLSQVHFGEAVLRGALFFERLLISGAGMAFVVWFVYFVGQGKRRVFS